MKNKLLLLLFLILALVLVSFALLFSGKENRFKNTSPLTKDKNANGDNIVPESKEEVYQYSMNQDSKEIPEGFNNVMEYFDEMNKEYYNDCKLMDFGGEDPMQMDDQEFVDYYDRSLQEVLTQINYNSIKNELDYYRGVNTIVDGGYCMFVNVEKDGIKIIYYVDKQNNLKEANL